MKKQLLSLALAAMATPAFVASAYGTVTELWKYQGNELSAAWNGNAPNWSSADAIKDYPCARFGVGHDGKIYVVNMKTMSIAAVDGSGMNDVYKLPALEGEGDYYGTAISVDDAGNFLVGHQFTKAPESSTVWSVYSPSTGKIKHFNLGEPKDWTEQLSNHTGIGRIDCVGRVLGDLTDQAVFFIGPQSKYAQLIRVVTAYGSGNGDVDGIEMSAPDGVAVYLGSSLATNIAQPKFATYDDFIAHMSATGYFCDGFYFSSCMGNGKWDQSYTTFNNGASDASFQTNMKKNIIAATNGFDTFVLNGKRYFVRNYVTAEEYPANSHTMDVAILNENGSIAAVWKNPDYMATNGYSSITAEPLEDGTANIYIYNSNSPDNVTGFGAAAMINFKPEAPEDIYGGKNNPIKVSNAEELIAMRDYLNKGDNYIEITDDIDMAGYPYIAPIAEGTGIRVILDGKNHVIKNLVCNDTIKVCNGSLLGMLSGSVKNLGMENVQISVGWYCVGGIAGVTNDDAVIENCYVTGSIKGAAAGGLVGSNAGNLTITSCYSQADIEDFRGGHAGGLVGRSDAPLVINNAYASGSVKAMVAASGIVTAQNSTSIDLNNVIAWNPKVESEAMASAVCSASNPDVYCVLTDHNLYVWDGIAVSGENPDKGDKSTAELQAIAVKWNGYADKLVNDMPVLAWQLGDGGVEGVIADEAVDADAPAVYYNLQGIQVANPTKGIYIVKRGNKVTKEIVRD